MKRKTTNTIKKIRKVKLPPAVEKQEKPKARGLSKKDPLFYAKIGQLSAKKRALSSEEFAEMAKRSHPRGPGGYHCGRKKKPSPKVA